MHVQQPPAEVARLNPKTLAPSRTTSSMAAVQAFDSGSSGVTTVGATSKSYAASKSYPSGPIAKDPALTALISGAPSLSPARVAESDVPDQPCRR